jgi:hypothetical protein
LTHHQSTTPTTTITTNMSHFHGLQGLRLATVNARHVSNCDQGTRSDRATALHVDDTVVVRHGRHDLNRSVIVDLSFPPQRQRGS